MHCKEADKLSNTGRLAGQCLANSEIRLEGVLGSRLSLDGLISPERETLLLYLSPSCAELTPSLVKSLSKPVTLLVPDGTWSQARRLWSKLSQQPGVRTVKVRFERPSEYRLRNTQKSDGLATFEAIARALGVLEGAEVRAAMEKVFGMFVERSLYMRGLFAAPHR
jgi:DTW domain-containing protein YfiP